MTRLAYLSTDKGIAYGGAKGAAVHVEELATAFARTGAEVLLLVADSVPSAPLSRARLRVEVMPGPGKGARADDRLAAEPDRVSWLEQRLRAFGADVLYERLALYSGAGSDVARRLGLPHLVELNAPLLAEARRYRQLERADVADRLELRTIVNADIVLAVSRPLAGYADERGARRVELVPNAVDPTRYVRAQPRNGDPTVAVFAGSIRPWHGIDCLAEAWDLLGDAAPELLVVGDGPGRSLLEQVGARITGVVPHAMVPGLLGGADIGLAPYAADAPDYFSPLKLFEYLAAGLATIAADLPGVRDIAGEETALIVPPGDARALADAVAALAGDPAGRERLGEAGRTLVLTQHTWDDRARTILDLAEPLARRGAGRTAASKLLLPAEPPSVLPTEPPRRTPVPDDPALPRLPVLLDPQAMAPVLQRSLGPHAGVPDVRIHYLRYKPGTNIVVHYAVGLDGRSCDAIAMITAGGRLARRAAKPENLALARLVDGRSPAPMPLHYIPDLDALIQWFPLDLDVPGLAVPPERLLDDLHAAGIRLGAAVGDPAVLAYKPRRRAVLRVGEYVLKIYAKRGEFDQAAAGLRAAGGLGSVRTAPLEGHLPARLVTVQRLLSGSRPSRPADVAIEAGELLSELQAASTPGAPAQPFHQLAAAEMSAQLVKAILPALRSRVEELLGELEATMPVIDRLVPSHGDFNARQLLVQRDGLAVVDFDAMCLAPAALDPAKYSAYLVLGGPGDLAEALDVLEELLEGYGGRPPGLSWYLATSILRRSPRPFRYLDEDWPERVEGMIAASEAALRS